MLGSCFWMREDLTKVPVHKRGFGFVFQDYALFPHKNVYDNVAFGSAYAQMVGGEDAFSCGSGVGTGGVSGF